MPRKPCDNQYMRPSKQFFKKLLFASPLLAVMVCFQNFDENSIVEQMQGIKVEEKTILLHATTLNGAAEEIFFQQYAPEAKMFGQKMGEKVRFGFNQRQYDTFVDNGQQQQVLEPEMRMQVVGSSQAGGAGVDIVNVDRVRLKIADNVTCDYNPIRESVQFRTPISDRSNLQVEHQNKTNTGRVSWQMSW